jgi:hypothetical protein
MKRFTYCLLSLFPLFLTALVGCGGSTSSMPTKAAAPLEKPAPPASAQ